MKTLRIMNKAIKTAALSAFAIMSVGAVSAQNKVELTVTNIPNSNGKILVATSKGQTGMVQAKQGSMTIDVENVPDGEVAFYVMHDENGNMECEMENGMPKEYVGVAYANVSKDNKAVTVKLENIPEKVTKAKAE